MMTMTMMMTNTNKIGTICFSREEAFFLIEFFFVGGRCFFPIYGNVQVSSMTHIFGR